jgi:hypothetical protein
MVIDFATHDPSGNFLIGGGQMDGVIYVYRIEAGAGKHESGCRLALDQRVAVVRFPSAERTDVSVTPTERYVFGSNNGINGLARYDFDSSAG